MFVCICNAINENSVKRAIDEGARTAKDVYLAHRCAPCCGKCKPEIVQLIVDHAPPPARVLKVIPGGHPCPDQDTGPGIELPDDLPLAAE